MGAALALCSAPISSRDRARSHTQAAPSHPVMQPAGIASEGVVDSGPEAPGGGVDSCPQRVTMAPQHALCALPTATGAAMALPTQKAVLPPWVVLLPPWVVLLWPCCEAEAEAGDEEGEGEGEGGYGGGAAVAMMSRQPSPPLMR